MIRMGITNIPLGVVYWTPIIFRPEGTYYPTAYEKLPIDSRWETEASGLSTISVEVFDKDGNIIESKIHSDIDLIDSKNYVFDWRTSLVKEVSSIIPKILLATLIVFPLVLYLKKQNK